MNKKTQLEVGNVLFIILIVIALFAAVSYAIVSSTRLGSNEKNISDDNAKLLAMRIVQYGASISTAITRMKLVNECTDEEISFENNYVSGYTNPNSPPSKRCHVFDPAGGGVAFDLLYKGTLIDKYPVGPPRFQTGCMPTCYSAAGIGTNKYDVFMIMQTHPGYPLYHQPFLKVCKAVNKLIASDENLTFTGHGFYHGAVYVLFTGIFPSESPLPVAIGDDRTGKYSAFCAQSGGWETIVIPVLIR